MKVNIQKEVRTMMSNEEYKHFSAKDWEIIYKSVMHEYGKAIHERDEIRKIEDPKIRKERSIENAKRSIELKRVWYKAETKYQEVFYSEWFKR